MKNYTMRILLILNLCLGCICFSQGTVNENLNKITPKSPNSEAFEKYGIVPVSLSAGVITPSIPLFKLSAGNNIFEANINYSSQGLRVDEHPTNLGMGWSLNLGSITRSVKDLPDESYQRFTDISQITGNDNLYIGNTLANTPNIDSERDIFSLNVDGYSTKFILDSDQYQNITIKKLTIDNIDIQILLNPISDLSENVDSTHKIKITTPNGTKYYFGGNNGVERTYCRPYQQSGIGPQVYTTAWLLSKIEYVSGNIINIAYNQKQVEYIDGLSQSVTVKYPIQTNTQSALPQLGAVNTSKSLIRSIIASPLSIENGNQTINFQIDTFDNYIDGTFPKISQINESYNSILIKQIKFSYTNYSSLSVGDNTNTIVANRPFLEQVIYNDRDQNKKYDYVLEYYDPQSLPKRFSYAQDILGYYNGENNKNLIFNSLTDYSYWPSHNLIKSDSEELNNFLYNVTGDRKPNKNFAKNGSLRKITYPTKGYSLFDYEGNLTNNREMIYPDYSQISLENIPNVVTTNTSKDIPPIPFNQKFYITGHITTSQDLEPGSQTCNPDEQHDDKGKITIYKDGTKMDITSVTNIGNTTFVPEVYLPIGGASPQQWFQNDSPVRYYVDMEVGKSYQLRLMTPKCVKSTVYFSYRNEEPYQGDYVEAGGLRINSVTNYDADDKIISKKKYSYEGGAYTTGIPQSTMDISDVDIILTNDSGYVAGLRQTKSITLSSFPKWSLRNISGEFYTYSKVIEEDRDLDNKKGNITHVFDTSNSILPVSIQNTETSSSNLSNIKYRSNEIETIFFNNENDTIQKVKNNFYANPNFQQRFYDYTAKSTLERHSAYYLNPNTYLDNINIATAANDPRWWSVMKSFISQTWDYLQSNVTTDYKNGTPLTTTTEYFYNSPSHYQLTRQKTTFPDSSYQTTDYSYAYERANQKLIDANMIGIPLVTETKKNGKTISKTETVYPDVLPDAQTGNLLLPKSISTLDLVTGNLAAEVTYNQYDSKGNLLQYTTKSGVPTAIIWGYNNTQPIAKVEGATYGQVSGYISSIVSKSDMDNTNGTPTSEQDLMDALDSFRNNSALTGYQITTYTYDPLIGVRSITPPNGIRQVYIYDTANRLKEVREQKQTGNLLKEYQYHYKP